VYGGLSGSPVFYKDGKERCVVAIHTAGDLAGTSATRLTAEVVQNLAEWSSAG
jgi:V8-like Glu-specific endopeptidase